MSKWLKAQTEPTKEMVDWFDTRTNKHISLVVSRPIL